MRDVITVRLEPALARQLARVAEQTGRSRSVLVRDAIRRHLTRLQFEQLRARLAPMARQAGYRTDADVFRDIS